MAGNGVTKNTGKATIFSPLTSSSREFELCSTQPLSWLQLDDHRESTKPTLTLPAPLINLLSPLIGPVDPPLRGRLPARLPQGCAHSVLPLRLVRRTCSYVRCSPVRMGNSSSLKRRTAHGAHPLTRTTVRTCYRFASSLPPSLLLPPSYVAASARSLRCHCDS